jgi:hypothetical protein
MPCSGWPEAQSSRPQDGSVSGVIRALFLIRPGLAGHHDHLAAAAGRGVSIDRKMTRTVDAMCELGQTRRIMR